MMSDRNRYSSDQQYGGYREGTQARRPAPVQPDPYAPRAQTVRQPYAPEQGREQRPQQPQQKQRSASQKQGVGGLHKGTVDAIILLLMFIAGPLCGLLGVFFRVMLWVFLGVEGLALVLMWGLRRFMLRGRIVLTCVLLLLMTLALLAGINIGSQPGDFQTYGEGSSSQKAQQTQPPWGAVSGVGLGGLTSVDHETPEPAVQEMQQAFTPDAGLQAASQPDDGMVFPTASATESPMGTVMTAAEAVMKSYMENWQQQNWEGMVQYVTPTWRSAQTNPQLQLYWNHGIWLLQEWTMTAQNAGLNADSITFSILADLSKNTSAGERVTKRFDGIVLKVDNTWYVDPDSMRNGIPVTETASAMAASNAQAAQQTASEGEQAPLVSSSTDEQQSGGTNPNLTLWYNSDGGSYYHLMQKCESIGQKYYDKMVAFTYSELDSTTYKNLKPCHTCGAPDRP